MKIVFFFTYLARPEIWKILHRNRAFLLDALYNEPSAWSRNLLYYTSSLSCVERDGNNAASPALFPYYQKNQVGFLNKLINSELMQLKQLHGLTRSAINHIINQRGPKLVEGPMDIWFTLLWSVNDGGGWYYNASLFCKIASLVEKKDIWGKSSSRSSLFTKCAIWKCMM